MILGGVPSPLKGHNQPYGTCPLFVLFPLTLVGGGGVPTSALVDRHLSYNQNSVLILYLGS